MDRQRAGAGRPCFHFPWAMRAKARAPSHGCGGTPEVAGADLTALLILAGQGEHAGLLRRRGQIGSLDDCAIQRTGCHGDDVRVALHADHEGGLGQRSQQISRASFTPAPRPTGLASTVAWIPGYRNLRRPQTARAGATCCGRRRGLLRAWRYGEMIDGPTLPKGSTAHTSILPLTVSMAAIPA
jgi:hypothetical protein